MPLKTADNNFGCAKWIVSSAYSDGCTHISLASALTSASSGDTIFMRPGTYTENVTLKAGVNIVAYDADALTPNVVVHGECSFSGVGSVSLSGINFQTNSNFFLAVSGSSASSVYLKDCYFNCTNNTGLSFTTSNSSAVIFLDNCLGDIGTTGIAPYSMSSIGTLEIKNTRITNSGNSVTAANNSAGNVFINWSEFYNAFSSSGSGVFATRYTNIDVDSLNISAYTNNSSSANNFFYFSSLITGSAHSIVNNGNIVLSETILDTTNNVAISGSGTITYSTIILEDGALTISNTLNPYNIAIGAITFDGGANYLDNYAEGTFTPTVNTSNNDMTGVSYSLQVGYYTRIGRILHVQCNVIYTASGIGTGHLVVGGMPIPSANIASLGSNGACLIQGPIIVAGSQGLHAHIASNATTVDFEFSNSATTLGWIMTTASATLTFTLDYQI